MAKKQEAGKKPEARKKSGAGGKKGGRGKPGAEPLRRKDGDGDTHAPPGTKTGLGEGRGLAKAGGSDFDPGDQPKVGGLGES